MNKHENVVIKLDRGKSKSIKNQNLNFNKF